MRFIVNSNYTGIFPRHNKEYIMSEKDIDEKIQGVFESAVEKGNDDDTIKLALVKAGVKFSSVNAIFNKLMIEGGHRLSKVEKAKVVDEACKGFDLSEEEIFDNAVKSICEGAGTITEKSAIASIRSWAKTNGIECFRKPRGGNGQGRKGFASDFYDMLRANPSASVDEVNAYINEQPDRTEGSEVSKNVINNASHYRGIAKLSNDIYASV